MKKRALLMMLLAIIILSLTAIAWGDATDSAVSRLKDKSEKARAKASRELIGKGHTVVSKITPLLSDKNIEAQMRAAYILGKGATLYSNRYHKNRGVYEYSLSESREIRFIDN